MFRCLSLAAHFGFEMFGGHFVGGVVWRMVVQKSLSGVAKAETFVIYDDPKQTQAETNACVMFGALPESLPNAQMCFSWLFRAS